MSRQPQSVAAAAAAIRASENAVMIGDRMDTDIVAGVESGVENDPGP
jgi:ribonucleotide monophosphatase NagD (HAD superfamily)